MIVLGALLFAPLQIGAGSVSAVSPTPPRAACSPSPMSATVKIVVNRINSIRASYGLSPAHYTDAYAAQVLRGIRANSDPAFVPLTASITEEDSVWGTVPGSTSSVASAVAIVNAWVYHDGWCGSQDATWNADCTAPHAPGCDGHRRIILSSPPSKRSSLYIDVVVARGTYSGLAAVDVAALLVWKT